MKGTNILKSNKRYPPHGYCMSTHILAKKFLHLPYLNHKEKCSHISHLLPDSSAYPNMYLCRCSLGRVVDSRSWSKFTNSNLYTFYLPGLTGLINPNGSLLSILPWVGMIPHISIHGELHPFLIGRWVCLIWILLNIFLITNKSFVVISWANVAEWQWVSNHSICS